MPAARKRKAAAAPAGRAAKRTKKPAAGAPQQRVVLTGWQAERLLGALCAGASGKKCLVAVDGGGAARKKAAVAAAEGAGATTATLEKCGCCLNQGAVDKLVKAGGEWGGYDCVVLAPSPVVDVAELIEASPKFFGVGQPDGAQVAVVAAVPVPELVQGLWCSATVAEWVPDRSAHCDEADEDDVRGVHAVLHEHIQSAHAVCLLDEAAAGATAAAKARQLVAALNPGAVVLSCPSSSDGGVGGVWGWLGGGPLPEAWAAQVGAEWRAVPPEFFPHASGVARLAAGELPAVGGVPADAASVVEERGGAVVYVGARPYPAVGLHEAVTALQSPLVGGGVVAYARGTVWVAEDAAHSYDVVASGGHWSVAKGAPWGVGNPQRQEVFVFPWGDEEGAAAHVQQMLDALCEPAAAPAAAAPKRTAGMTAATVLKEWDDDDSDDDDADGAGSASSFYEEHTLQMDLPEGPGELRVDAQAVAELQGVVDAGGGGGGRRKKKSPMPAPAAPSPIASWRVQYPTVVVNPGGEERSLNDWWEIAQQDSRGRPAARGSADWYTNGVRYWNSLRADLRGVELDELHWYDVVHSRGCFEAWALRGGRAVDLGGGLGRFASGVLVDYYDTVDIVESAPHLVTAAGAVLGEDRLRRCGRRGRLGAVHELPLQQLDPHALCGAGGGSKALEGVTGGGCYDLAAVTWVLMFLTDADVLLLLLRLKCLLAPGAKLFVKENALEAEFAVNCENSSTNRSRAHYRALFGAAGYTVEAEDDMAHVPSQDNLHAMEEARARAAACMYFGASSGASLYDPAPLIQEELSVAVLEEGTAVCCQYLVDRCGVNQEDACAALGRFVDACESELVVSYLLTGVDHRRMPHSVLATADLHLVSQQFAEPPTIRVYGVAPKQPSAPQHLTSRLPFAPHAPGGDADAPMLSDDEDTAPVKRVTSHRSTRAISPACFHDPAGLAPL